MILHFPSLDTLRLALTSGAIAEDVRATQVRFRWDEDRSLWVEPAAKLSAAAEKELRRLGVHFPREGAPDLVDQAANWLQMLPLTREARAAELGDKTPVLFELAKAGQLAEVATEILRLGNDRQSFRWLGDETETRALLRVIGPPYYALLRALDHAGEDGAPIAYREVAPRLWVQLGYTHPLAEQLRPPPGQLLLLRPPHQWICMPEAKLRDIYEVFDFQVPAPECAWRDVELTSRIHVPVRLTRGGAAEAPELWLLREQGIAQLEELVSSSDNELLSRLAFAVGESEDEGARLVVLRVRPSKNAPPVLVLDGVALRSYLRIPNLFLPVGMALNPPLRRDAVVKLLAEDKTRIHWLVPHQDLTFTLESISDDAFRPLPAWIDYVLEHEHQAIKAWIGASQFDFEGFICTEEATRAKKPPKDAPKQPREPDGKRDDGKPRESGAGEQKPQKPAEIEVETEVAPVELEERLHAAEEAFTALKAPLDDPQRLPLWVEMARLNGALSQHSDAAICWGNAFWEHPRLEAEWARAWYWLEAKQPSGEALPPAARILRLVSAEATQANLRLVTAYLLWAAALPKVTGESRPAAPHADLQPHLNRVQQYIEKHEAALGVRVAWLAWVALERLSGGDVLLLARARDRMLERLFQQGLTPDLDLPGFLRFAGMQASSRFRPLRDQVVRLRRVVQDWAKKGSMPTPETHAYIDLIFAYGLARLGETTEAHKLRGVAGQLLANADEVHSWLYEAFAYRVQQALDGKPAAGTLPEKLLRQRADLEHPDFLEHITDRQQRKEAERTQTELCVKIDRVRQKSRILEPHERIDPYRAIKAVGNDELTRELARLTDMHDRVELGEHLQKLLAGKRKFKGASRPEARILSAALQLAPRLGQSFGEELLDRVPAQLAKAKNAEESADLLEKSLVLAAHCDRKEDMERVFAQFHQLLRKPGEITYDALMRLTTGCFRTLRKFGLHDAVTQLMQRVEEIVEGDASLRTDARKVYAGSNLRMRLCLLLELASGWFFFGQEQKARKILDEAREVMLRQELPTVFQVEVAAAYLAALAQAPLDFALSRVMEFFRKVEGVYDVFITTSHYSLSRLVVVEAMMLALVSDDYTLDREARRRLDDDEFLVRRRIHRDVRAALAQAGM